MEVKVKSKGEGLYSCSYTPTSPLKHTVAVAWGGVSVPKSPFRVSSQSQHCVTRGRDVPPKSGAPFKVDTKAKVVQTVTSFKTENINVIQAEQLKSEQKLNVVNSKHSEVKRKTKKPLIIITYTEERYSC